MLCTLMPEFTDLWCMFRKDTLCTLMLGCIKKGGPLEAATACRGIGTSTDPHTLIAHSAVPVSDIVISRCVLVCPEWNGYIIYLAFDLA